MMMQKMIKLLLLMALCLGLALAFTACSSDDDDSNSPTISGGTGKDDVYVGWKLVIEDKLTDGTSKAALIAGEGSFRQGQGYYMAGEFNNYLRYDTGFSGGIMVEFDAQGYIPGEEMHDGNDEMTIAIIQDAPPGTAWANWRVLPYYLFQLRKMANYSGDIAMDGLKMKCGSANRSSYDGEWKTSMGQGLVGHPLSWDTNHKYHWLIMIEPGWIELRRDNQPIFQDGLDGAIFSTDPNYVYIGGGEGFDYSPNNITYSNVKIYKKN